MIKGQRKIGLTPESVLNKISEYDVFMRYMPQKNWKLNVVTLSPFRKEDNPSFIIGNRYGALFFIDFADGTKRGNCFTFVKLLHNFNTIDQVLRMIDQDFGLGISTGIVGDYKKNHQ